VGEYIVEECAAGTRVRSYFKLIFPWLRSENRHTGLVLSRSGLNRTDAVS
jgi:hypothetical protein